MPKKQKPIYLMDPKNPVVAKYKPLFKEFAAPDKNSFALQVNKDCVEECNVIGVQHFIMALQHHPRLIEKMVFCLEIDFTEVEDSELTLPPTFWKAQPEYQLWFNRLQDCGVMLFFLNDEHARLYCLAGDMIANNEVTVECDADGKNGQIGFEGEKLHTIMQRLFHSCWFMLIYCHGTGFNPQPYIESIIADFGVPITYEQVYEKYQEDMSKGLKVRAVPSKMES